MSSTLKLPAPIEPKRFGAKPRPEIERAALRAQINARFDNTLNYLAK